ARQEEPLRLFPDDGPESAEREKGFTERGKSSLRNAVQMQRNLIQFAKRLNTIAIQIERLRFIMTWQDPCLSTVCACLALCASLACTGFFWLLWAVFGRAAMPVLVWSLGTVVLLPRTQRAQVLNGFLKLRALRDRWIGHGDQLEEALKSLWARIPDRTESTHRELFQNCVLLR
ncbi:unnamed protein product, partial [Polarella glacialis]